MLLVEKMNYKAPDMTETEKIIYEYIMKNSTAFSLESIGYVAKQLGISRTSLVRFAKMMGFAGYSDFKKCLQNEEILRSSPMDRFKSLKQSGYISSAKTLLDQELFNMSEAIDKIDYKDFNKLVKLIKESKKVYLAGTKEEHFLCSILAYRLNGMGISAEVISRDYLDFGEQIIISGEDNLFIFFDFYPHSKPLEKTAKMLEHTDAVVVLMTDYVKSPIHEYAELVFTCASKTDYLMNSMSAGLILINFLISEIFNQYEDYVIEILEKRQKLRKEFMEDVYE